MQKILSQKVVNPFLKSVVFSKNVEIWYAMKFPIADFLLIYTFSVSLALL